MLLRPEWGHAVHNKARASPSVLSAPGFLSVGAAGLCSPSRPRGGDFGEGTLVGDEFIMSAVSHTTCAIRSVKRVQMSSLRVAVQPEAFYVIVTAAAA